MLKKVCCDDKIKILNFSIRLLEDIDGSEYTQEDQFVGWISKDNNVVVDIYPLPETIRDEDGGFEFMGSFSEKPKTNKVEFSIRTKGLVFYKQPKIGDQSEDVPGSYAVYHATKEGNK